MRLGIHLPQYGRAASPDAIVDVARRAEELGFADVWVSDHVLQPVGQDYPSAYLFEPLLTLGWAAAATSRIGLGTSVLVVPQYHPLQLANSLASLDKLSAGRLTVGIGVGWSEAEFDALDQDFASRGKRTDEALDIFRSVWETGSAEHHGNYYEFDPVKILPQPEAARVPVWVGGRGAAAMRRARQADGYQGIGMPPDDLAPIVTELRSARPEPDFTISYRTGWDPQGMDPAQIAEERAAYEEAGVQHVVSAPWRTDPADWIRSMELLVEIVQPDEPTID